MLFQKINEYFNLDVEFANTFVRRDGNLNIDIESPVCDKNLEIYQTVFQQTENLYQGLDLSEFKFLIKRNFLGDSIQTQKTDQVIRLLTNLEIV